MNQKLQYAALSVMAVLGLAFALCYGNVYRNDTQHVVYLCFSIFAALEAILTASALFLHAKGRKGKWVSGVDVLSGILAVPILLFSAVWLLHWLGLDLLPPPQQ